MKSYAFALILAVVWAAAGGCLPHKEKDICPFDDTKLVYNPNDPYPFCQVEDPFHNTHEYCPQFEQGWGNAIWFADGADSTYCDDLASCTACTCFRPCAVPEDCPTPTNGTAEPICLHDDGGGPMPGWCFLSCDNGERCPSGMECHFYPEDPAFVCAWVTQGARCSVAPWHR